MACAFLIYPTDARSVGALRHFGGLNLLDAQRNYKPTTNHPRARPEDQGSNGSQSMGMGRAPGSAMCVDAIDDAVGDAEVERAAGLAGEDVSLGDWWPIRPVSPLDRLLNRRPAGAAAPSRPGTTR